MRQEGPVLRLHGDCKLNVMALHCNSFWQMQEFIQKKKKKDKLTIMYRKDQTTKSESWLKTCDIVHCSNGPHRKRLNAMREVRSRDQPPPFNHCFLQMYLGKGVCLWSYCSLPNGGFLSWITLLLKMTCRLLKKMLHLKDMVKIIVRDSHLQFGWNKSKAPW